MGYPYGIIDSHAKYMQIINTHFEDEILTYGQVGVVYNKLDQIGATIRYQKQKKRYELALARCINATTAYTVTKACVYTLPDLLGYLNDVPNSFGQLVLNQKETALLFNIIERKSKINNLFNHAN